MWKGHSCAQAQADRRIQLPFFITFTSAEIKYLTNILLLLQLSLSAALTLVDLFVDTMKRYRKGSHFNKKWDNTTTLAEQCVLPGHNKLKTWYGIIFSLHWFRDRSTHIRSHSFILIVDVFLSEVKRRFSKESWDTSFDSLQSHIL